MGKLVYSAIQSLDGYIEDEGGNFGWAEPDEEVHHLANELARTVGTHLLGRRMYEVMSAWDRLELSGQPPVEREFAEIWRSADKIVYSRTLEDVTTPRTRLEREFDPEAVRGLKAAADRDLSVSGPSLAATAFEAGIVDELHLFFIPTVVGGGKQALPDDVRMTLELLDERRCGNGTVFLRYATL